MRVVLTDHEVTASSADRIEVNARRVTIFASGGESYVISQNEDDTLRIEAPSGELTLEVISTAPCVARVTAQKSCRSCASRLTRRQGPCDLHKGGAPSGSSRRGPRVIKSPKPKTVTCEDCGSTIEYEPEHLFRMASLPSSDDVGPMAVKCPKCGGHGFPRR